MIVHRLRPLLMLGVLVAMLGGATGARANDARVRATIMKESRLIRLNPEIRSALRAARLAPRNTPKLIHAFQSLELALAGAAAAVARTHASTAAGRKGRRDWITATRALAIGYGEYVAALRSLEKGHLRLAKRRAKLAVIAISVAEKLGARADRELGLV